MIITYLNLNSDGRPSHTHQTELHRQRPRLASCDSDLQTPKALQSLFFAFQPLLCSSTENIYSLSSNTTFFTSFLGFHVPLFCDTKYRTVFLIFSNRLRALGKEANCVLRCRCPQGIAGTHHKVLRNLPGGTQMWKLSFPSAVNWHFSLWLAHAHKSNTHSWC